MYCPNCGTQTTNTAAFCRSCGANLSLVPQALTGNLVAPQEYDKHGRPKKPKSIGEGVTTIFTGLGFIVTAIATLYYAPAGRLWWYWLFIPAFSCIGGGVATLLEIWNSQQRAAQGQLPASPPPAPAQILERNTYEMAPPPSVVEATTRQLDPNRERQK